MIKCQVKGDGSILMYRRGQQIGCDKTGSYFFCNNGNPLSLRQKRCWRKRGFFIVGD